MNILDAALDFARNGIPVFPLHGMHPEGGCTCRNPRCNHPAKHPLYSGGHNIATLDAETIITWWKKHPYANVGIPTGAVSGWYVVDIDQKSNGKKNYQNFVTSLPHFPEEATLKVQTGGGGYHLIYGAPNFARKVGCGTNIGKLQGVDFRGDGGYVVAPPSIHQSLNTYRWHDNFAFKGQDDHYDPTRLRPLPESIADLVSKTSAFNPSNELIPEGGRNDYLFKFACKLRHDGVQDAALSERVIQENINKCKPPLSIFEVKNTINSALKQEITPRSKRKESGNQSDQNDELKDDVAKLRQITRDHEFWMDHFRTGYVSFKVALQDQTEHWENWPIDSAQYRACVGKLFLATYKEIIPSRVLASFIEQIKDEVLYCEIEYDTFIRTAQHGGKIYIDLTDSHWHVIEIGESGWSLLQSKPAIKFIRSHNVGSLPIPKNTGSFASLKSVFHLKNEDDYHLLAAWMMFSLLPMGPYPILAIDGVAGSTKSSLTKQIRALIDPRKPAAQIMPGKTDDLFVHATNTHLMAFDNVSVIKKDLSDMLCSISTKTGWSKRAQYKDAQEISFEVCKPIIFNSINPVIEYPDLSDRSIRLSLLPLSERDGAPRCSMEEVYQAFEQTIPDILGAICNAIAFALPSYKNIKNVPSKLRMIDFARWGVAATPVLTNSGRSFIDVYLNNRCHSVEPIMEDHVLNAAIFAFMQGKTSYRNSPRQLFTELKNMTDISEQRDKSFPKAVNSLTKMMNESVTALKQVGITFTCGKDGDGNRWIELDYNPDPAESYFEEDSAEYDLDDSHNEASGLFDCRYIENQTEAFSLLKDLSQQQHCIGLSLITSGEKNLILLASATTRCVIDSGQIQDVQELESLLQALKCVSHDAINCMSALKNQGISLETLDCTALAHHVISGDHKSIEDLARIYLSDISTLIGKDLPADWVKTPTLAQINQLTAPAEITRLVYEKLRALLINRDQKRAYTLVKAAQHCIVTMQQRGVMIDLEGYQTHINQLQLHYDGLVVQWNSVAPGTLFSSLHQLSAWINTELIDKNFDWPTTKSGDYSTAAEVFALHGNALSNRAQSVVSSILLPLKTVSKELNSFGAKFLAHVNPETCRVHAAFNLMGTITGRMSCSKPNLQQIPRKREYRQFFKAPKGSKLVIADYSQMELRIAAIIAEESLLLQAYEEGIDTHRLTAALLLAKEPEEVTADERQLAKAVNFGLLYGQGALGLQAYAASKYGITMNLEEAKAYRANWFQNYPGFSRWHNCAYSKAKKEMSVRTPAGRIRYFESAHSTSPKGLKQTEVYNTPIQGGAAEVLLAALGNLAHAIHQSKLEQVIFPVAAIHDEIIVEALDGYAEQARQLLTDAMTQGMLDIFPDACVRSLVEAHIGETWADK